MWKRRSKVGAMTREPPPWPPLALLKVTVLRGVGLAVRDYWKNSSDPYVLLTKGTEKLKTKSVRRNLNPEWNEELTLTVTEPVDPIKVEVYDRDTFSPDDPMGTAEISIEPLLEAVRMGLDNLPEGTIIRKITPSRQNYLAEESPIYWSNGGIVQDIVLRLRKVESGELQMQLRWMSMANVRFV